MKRNIREAAKVIRSKNAGPFELTLDIILKTPALYARFREQEIISREAIAKLYGVPVTDILNIIYFDPANAIKVTMKRWQSSGGPGERDVYGAQQHAPLLALEYEDA